MRLDKPNLGWVVAGVLALGVSAASALAQSIRLTPVEARLDATPGRSLVIPVLLTGRAEAGKLSDAVVMTWSNGEPLAAMLWRVEVSAAGAPPTWLPPPGTWTATPASESPDLSTPATPGAVVSWFVVTDPMPSVPKPAAGSSLRLHERSIPVRWLAAERDTSGPRPNPPTRPIVGDSRTQLTPPRDLLLPDLHSPVRRWRAWIAMRLPTVSRPADVPEFEPPVLEAIASQTESRWNVALIALAAEDRGLCDRLVTRLSCCADFGSGVIAPAWPPNLSDTDELLADLLDPALNAAARRSRVEAWLDAQPTAVAWVIDDAAGSPTAASVGLANLGDRRQLARVELVSAASDVARDPVMLDPGSARPIAVNRPPVSRDELPRTVAGSARLGPAALPIELLPAASPARPPGLKLAPFFRQYTLESWLDSAREVPDPGVAAMLMTGPGGEWIVHLESLTPHPDEDAGQTTIELWVGLGDSSRIITLVRHVDSNVTIAGRGLRGGQFNPKFAASDPPPDKTTNPHPWTVQIELPIDAIPKDQMLALGLTITTPTARSAFPRPMLPWQKEPGRTVIDLSPWD